jgi:hypothetical protein
VSCLSSPWYCLGANTLTGPSHTARRAVTTGDPLYSLEVLYHTRKVPEPKQLRTLMLTARVSCSELSAVKARYHASLQAWGGEQNRKLLELSGVR